MSFTPAIPSLSAPMGASPKPTLVLDLEGVAGQEVKLHEWLDASDGSYYDCVVDWGDETVEKLDKDNFQTISHTYDAGGGVSTQLEDSSVRARIVGKCEFLTDRSISSADYALRPYLSLVSSENTSPLKNGKGIFNKCTILQTIGNSVMENCTNATNLLGTFRHNGNLKYIPENALDSLIKNQNWYIFYYGCGKLTSAPINLWSATNYANVLTACVNLRDAYFLNINPTSTAYMLNSLIELLPNITSSGEIGTLHLRKNITEAITSFTAEDEAAANALGWTIVDEGIVTS